MVLFCESYQPKFVYQGCLGFSISIVTVEVGAITAVISPSSFLRRSTGLVPTALVIILILRVKSHTIMVGEPVAYITGIETNEQSVVRSFVCDRKIIVFSIFISIRNSVNFHPKLTWNLSQLMNLLSLLL